MDWVVLRNRMTTLDARNKRRVAAALDELARRIGFRLVPGFSERVVFRELFLSGLTLLDPAIAISYPVIAGRPVFASSSEPRPSPFERAQLARELLAGPADAARLAELGIAVVYKPDWSETTGVTEVRPGIFVVDALFSASRAPETAS